MSQMTQNPFLLAADNSPLLLPLLRSDPKLASSQDEHGYSLVHAAASYNHLDLLRALVNEFGVDPNLTDEDGETALFVVETVECAKVMVEEIHADTTVKGDEGKTALEKFAAEGEFPEVALYLISQERSAATDSIANSTITGSLLDSSSIICQTRPLPNGVSIDVGTMAPEDAGEPVVDSEFRERIEALAARDDFQSEAGQQELRDIITEALKGDIGQSREVRQKIGQ